VGKTKILLDKRIERHPSQPRQIVNHIILLSLWSELVTCDRKGIQMIRARECVSLVIIEEKRELLVEFSTNF